MRVWSHHRRKWYISPLFFEVENHGILRFCKGRFADENGRCCVFGQTSKSLFFTSRTCKNSLLYLWGKLFSHFFFLLIANTFQLKKTFFLVFQSSFLLSMECRSFGFEDEENTNFFFSFMRQQSLPDPNISWFCRAYLVTAFTLICLSKNLRLLTSAASQRSWWNYLVVNMKKKNNLLEEVLVGRKGFR